MKYIWSFVIVFVIMYVYYLLFLIFNKKYKKFNSKKNRVEESYLIGKFNINMEKINYKRFLNINALSNSFIFGFSFAATQVTTNKIFLQILIGLIVMIPLIIIVYDLIGKYYVKKGYVKK